MSPEIPFQGTITFDLFARSNRLAQGWKGSIAYIIVFLVLAANFFNSPDPFEPRNFIPITIGLIAFPLVWWTTRSSLKRAYRDSPTVRLPLTGSISSSGFKVSNDQGTSEIKWTDFTALKTNNNTALLYRGPLIFNTIGSELFATEGEWSSALQIIKASIPNS